jgi:hypothetical protein
MATDDKLAKLLEKNIEASNRTTHAVRALVRFLFIQLAFLTAAAVIWQLGLAFPDEDSCSIVGCEPYGFVSAFVVLLVIAGVIISSFAGWSELELSAIPEGPERKRSNESSDVDQISNPLPTRINLSNTLPNGIKVCPKCKKRYKTMPYCTDCDLWL